MRRTAENLNYQVDEMMKRSSTLVPELRKGAMALVRIDAISAGQLHGVANQLEALSYSELRPESETETPEAARLSGLLAQAAALLAENREKIERQKALD